MHPPIHLPVPTNAYSEPGVYLATLICNWPAEEEDDRVAPANEADTMDLDAAAIHHLRQAIPCPALPTPPLSHTRHLPTPFTSVIVGRSAIFFASSFILGGYCNWINWAYDTILAAASTFGYVSPCPTHPPTHLAPHHSLTPPIHAPGSSA